MKMNDIGDQEEFAHFQKENGGNVPFYNVNFKYGHFYFLPPLSISSNILPLQLDVFSNQVHLLLLQLSKILAIEKAKGKKGRSFNEIRLSRWSVIPPEITK